MRMRMRTSARDRTQCHSLDHTGRSHADKGDKTPKELPRGRRDTQAGHEPREGHSERDGRGCGCDVGWGRLASSAGQHGSGHQTLDILGRLDAGDTAREWIGNPVGEKFRHGQGG